MAQESRQEMGFTTHIVNQMPNFESNPELFNLTTGMEMLAFPSTKNRDGNNSVMWKGFFSKPENQGSSSKTINEHTSDLYQTHGFSETLSTENLIVGADSSWQDDSSLRCVFPCEGNERPSQGLSLSLSSKKPSSIGLQSFELRETSLPTHHHHHHHQQQQQQQQQQDGFFGKSDNFQNHHSNLHQNHFQLKNSNYLVPAQELLNEFCNLGIKQSDPQKQKLHNMNQWEDENCGGSSRKQSSLNSLDLLELQKRKVKLLSMLEEVDRRYRQYSDQMKAVVGSFEAVAGAGGAMVYSALASKAMSRHFRCLRDGIVFQIKATKKSMGEKDSSSVAPGTTKGETPRLRLLEQTLRQQRAFQQMSMMESHPWRPQRGLPERSVSVLRAWLFEHFLHPYPSDVDKHILSRQTGLSRSQVSNWFINARVRLWKPMVEEMYMEETKEQDDIGSSDGITITAIEHQDNSRPNQNPNSPNRNPPPHHQPSSEDLKPTPDQLGRGYSESLSSIINTHPDKMDIKIGRNHQHQQQQQLHRRQFGRVPAETFGAVDLDFSSYTDHTSTTASYTADGAHQSFGNGVSLTLGLQQHGGTSMNLSFSPPSQHSLFFPRDHIEGCEQVQYSILDGEAQNLPYRNLMGAQLLHDLAG